MKILDTVKASSKKAEFPSVIIFLAMLVLTAMIQPNFFELNVLQSNLLTIAPLILASIGQAIIVINGGLDLSVGAAISLINCILATLMTDHPASAVLAFSAALIAAILIGMINGLATGYFKLPPMIVTFATSSIWFGIALYLMPQPGGYIPIWAVEFFSFNLFILSTPLILIILSLLLWLFIKKRRLGHYIYSVGSRESSAYANGINVKFIKLAAYVLGSFFIMLASFSITFQISSGDAYMGLPYTLTSVAAVVIGGISLSGGKGNIFGAVMGALILHMVTNLIYFANIPSTYQEFSKGIIIILALTTAIIYKSKEKNMTFS